MWYIFSRPQTLHSRIHRHSHQRALSLSLPPCSPQFVLLVMSSPSYWCHSCHNVVRIPSSPSLSCPSCGFGFVEAISSEPGLLVISGSPSRRDFPGFGDDGPRDLSSLGSARSPSSARGFLRRLFRGSRTSRQASENSPASLLQILEAASLLQRSRNTDGRNERGDVNDDGLLTTTEDVLGTPGLNREERSSITMLNSGEGVDSRMERPQDDMLSPRPLDIFLQRLLSGVLQGGRSGSPPASKAAVAAMPTFKISKQSLDSGACGGFDEGYNECAVCKEVFEVGGEVREMPCKHFYHSNCILPWLELHSSCPLCRHEMPVDAEERASSSSRVDGTAGVPVGEPTLVFIGIAGGDALLFSFIFLGASSRNEPTITASEVSEHSRTVVEEVVNGEPVSERGESTDPEVVASSSDTPGGELRTLLVDGRNSLEINNTEQTTEQINSSGVRNEALISENGRSLQSETLSSKETRPVQELSGFTAPEDGAGPSSSSNGMNTWRERRMQQVITESEEGHPSGIRSRGFFSWFFRHAAARHMSTSGAVEPSAEGNESTANSTVDSGSGSDTNVP